MLSSAILFPNALNVISFITVIPRNIGIASHEKLQKLRVGCNALNHASSVHSQWVFVASCVKPLARPVLQLLVFLASEQPYVHPPSEHVCKYYLCHT